MTGGLRKGIHSSRRGPSTWNGSPAGGRTTCVAAGAAGTFAGVTGGAHAAAVRRKVGRSLRIGSRISGWLSAGASRAATPAARRSHVLHPARRLRGLYSAQSARQKARSMNDAQPPCGPPASGPRPPCGPPGSGPRPPCGPPGSGPRPPCGPPRAVRDALLSHVHRGIALLGGEPSERVVDFSSIRFGSCAALSELGEHAGIVVRMLPRPKRSQQMPGLPPEPLWVRLTRGAREVGTAAFRGEDVFLRRASRIVATGSPSRAAMHRAATRLGALSPWWWSSRASESTLRKTSLR